MKFEIKMCCGWGMLLIKIAIVVTVDYPYYSFNVNVIHKCGFMMN